MIYFGKYLKDYLEFNNISQSEFAMRMGITQKHMNEILNGKTNITLEMAGNIERLTGINSSFIINIENSRKIKEKILSEYGSSENVKKVITKEYYISELKKNNWVTFKDESNILQVCIDLLNFLKIKDFGVVEKLEKQVLFKKTGNDFKKLALWIAHCDEMIKNQEVKEYNHCNLLFLVSDLKKYAYENVTNLHELQKILNNYGIFFVCEKAIKGTKVRGCFKVKGKHPAIYITDNYAGKDSLYFELFHELGHCKSDYNDAQNKVIIDGNKEKEEKADKFALNTMIDEESWREILKSDLKEVTLKNISEKYCIPMSFIVGRLAKNNKIKYDSKIYQKYYKI